MDDGQFDRIAKALADGRRFSILQAIIAAGEMSCGAVTERFPIAQATVSHHLKVLGDAGLIDVRRDGQHGFFSPRPAVIEGYLDELRHRTLGAKKAGRGRT